LQSGVLGCLFGALIGGAGWPCFVPAGEMFPLEDTATGRGGSESNKAKEGMLPRPASERSEVV